eukprot:SAG31_NODE_28593_length_407_cov_10.214286_1_plen_83_part_10
MFVSENARQTGSGAGCWLRPDSRADRAIDNSSVHRLLSTNTATQNGLYPAPRYSIYCSAYWYRAGTGYRYRAGLYRRLFFFSP